MQKLNSGRVVRTSRKSSNRVRRAATDAIMRLEPRQMMTAVLVGYDVTGQTGYGPASFNATTTDPSVISSPFVKGSGVLSSGTAASNAIGGSNFSLGATTEALAIAANQFFTFGLTVASGRTTSLSTVDDFYRRSSTGPAQTGVQYQIGNGAYTDITTIQNTVTASSGAPVAVDLTGISALQNLTGGTVVNFRLVPFNASGSTGTYYVFNGSSGPDLDVQGNSVLSNSNAQGIALDVSSTSVLESAGTVTIKVDRSGTGASNDINGDVTVPYSTANGTATSPTNYTAQTGSVVIPSGATSASFTIPIIGTTSQGGNKSFTVTLGTPSIVNQSSGVVVLGTSPSVETVTITDTTATYNVSAANFTVNETAGTAIVSISRTGYVADTANVGYTIGGGTAVNGTDYTTAASGTLTFAAGQSVVDISVPITNNAAAQGNKNFVVALTSATPASGDFAVLPTVKSATETIIDVATVYQTLTGKPSAISEIEAGGPFTSSYIQVLGDVAAGGTGATNSFQFLSYDVLDFNKATSPTLYPIVNSATSTVTSLSGLTLSLYDSVYTSTAGATYASQPGNFNVYFTADTTTSATSTGTGKLIFDTTKTDGLNTAQFAATGTPILLGTFSFSNANPNSYDTYSLTSLNATASTTLISELNAGSPIRLILTPTSQGVGAIAAEFDGTSGTGGAPILSLSAATSLQQQRFFLDTAATTVNKTAGTVSIKIDRSTPAPGTLADAATATYTVVDGSGKVGVDYGTTSGTAVFAAGASSTSFTIPLINNTAVYGDKTFSVTLSSASVSATSIAAVTTPAAEVVTVTDPRTANSATLASSISTIQVTGASTSASTSFSVEANNTSNGNFSSFAITDLVPQGLSGGQIGAINSISFEAVNSGTSTSFKAGLIDVYIVDDTSTSTAPSGPLKFNNGTGDIEGLDSQLGGKHLLGTINYSPSLSTTTYTVFSLASYNSSTAAILTADLNTNATIRVVLVPEDGVVNARFVGFDTAAVEYPTLLVNYTPASTTGLPSYLDPSSQATYDPGSNTLTVTGPTVFITDPTSLSQAAPNVVASGASATVSFATNVVSQVHLASLSLTNGASAKESNLSTHPIVVEVAGTFAVDATSTFDLGYGDLDIAGGSLSAVSSLVARGYNLTGGANWAGTGITSSAAAGNTAHTTAVGVVSNTSTNYTSFDGDPAVGANDVLLKYTYFGDANLSGKVDGSDYSLIDAGYSSPTTKTGWYNGDFNYDSSIDGSDYALIDNTFNNQATALVFTPTALVAASTAVVATPAAVVTKPGTHKVLPEIPVSLASHLAAHPVAHFAGTTNLPPFFSNTPIVVSTSDQTKAKKAGASSIVDLIGKATD